MGWHMRNVEDLKEEVVQLRDSVRHHSKRYTTCREAFKDLLRQLDLIRLEVNHTTGLALAKLSEEARTILEEIRRN